MAIRMLNKSYALFLIIIFYSVVSVASLNPFDNNLVLTFSDEILWNIDDSGVSKIGLYDQKGKRNFYHLIISNKSLIFRIRLNNNKNYRNIHVLDINLDGKRLDTYDWCLNNIQNLKYQKKLKSSMTVKNKICVINNEKNELIIKLHDQDFIELKKSSKIQINMKLDKKKIFLRYHMDGFNKSYNRYFNQYIKSEKITYDNVIQNEAKFAIKKIKDSSINKGLSTKQKNIILPIKYCYVVPPENLLKKIKTISYPCNDQNLEDNANKTMNDSIQRIKKIQLAEKEKRLKEKKLKQQKLKLKQITTNNHKKYLEEMQKKEEWAVTRREIEMSAKDRERWIQRCKRHWDRLVSPCYCQPYLNKAPDSVKDTCRK